MQWVILAVALISAAASVQVMLMLRGEKRRSRGAGGEKVRSTRYECAEASDSAEAGAERSESAEMLRARLAERRFSEGVMNVLNYENPAGKGNGA